MTFTLIFDKIKIEDIIERNKFYGARYISKF